MTVNTLKISRKEAEKARHRIILEVAIKEFSECGYYETDVDTIAQKANVGKGTVYRHFGNKRSLFLSVVEWGIETLKEKIDTALKDITGSQNRIRKALYVYFEFFEKHKNFFRVLFQERNNFRENVERRFEDKYFSNIRLMENIIKKGIDTGEFKRIDPCQGAVLLIGMLNASILDWLYKGTEDLLTDRVTIIEEIFFRGLIKQPGGQ